MGNLSLNFSRREFECPCCNNCDCDTVDSELLVVLEQLREKFGNPGITVTSGHRCKAHNDAVGSNDKSQHRVGRAADIVLEGVPAPYIYEYLDKKYPLKYGIGKYDDFTHIDTRREKARW